MHMKTHKNPYKHIVIDDFLQPDLFLKLRALFTNRLKENDMWEFSDDEMQHNTMRSYYYPGGMESIRSDDTLWEEGVMDQLYSVLLDKAFLDSVFEALRVCPGSFEPISIRSSILNMPAISSIERHVDFDTDYIQSRKHMEFHLNIILYLNDTWESAWGGELLLHDGPSAGEPLRYSPRPNRLVMFISDDESFHEINQVVCPATTTRKSMMAYMTFETR